MKFKIFRTAKSRGERMSRLADPAPATDVSYTIPSITVDDQVKYQTVAGFGGAFTEAAASTFYKMEPSLREQIINAYFNPVDGIGYNLCRTHINSCDFSLLNYAYDETADDFDLKHFSIARDRHALIPMIKEALRLTGDNMWLFASPWSPPAWMKTTGMMNKGGKLKPECRQVWAEYYCRYIREYEKEGIKIWGLTVQNEPEATQSWDSCIYTGEEERDFVRDYLGKALHAAGLQDVKLMIWDHNRDRMFERAKVVFDDPEAAKYVWGTAYHWYCGDFFDNVQRVHDAWPDKHLLFSEGCQEGGPHYGEWELGERYARSMIADLNRWTAAWVDWNILLDETGGPNHVGNLCSAPIIADTVNQVLNFQSSYYYIGHFSKFISRGAKRIIAAATKDELETTAFVNPDGKIVTVVLNRSEKEIKFCLKFRDEAVNITSLPRSIITVEIE